MTTTLFCQRLKMCTRKHTYRYDGHTHLHDLCPENYYELREVKTCESCFGLLESDIPVCKIGPCTRVHKTDHWNQTLHSSRWCPEQVSSCYCKCQQ